MDATNLDMGGFALYSVMGICVVFIALVLIMVMIKILVSVTSEKKATETAGNSAAAIADAALKAEPVLAPGTAGELSLYDTDPRDAAMIMAIVADELKKPLNELRFISIKEMKE